MDWPYFVLTDTQLLPPSCSLSSSSFVVSGQVSAWKSSTATRTSRSQATSAADQRAIASGSGWRDARNSDDPGTAGCHIPKSLLHRVLSSIQSIPRTDPTRECDKRGCQLSPARHARHLLSSTDLLLLAPPLHLPTRPLLRPSASATHRDTHHLRPLRHPDCHIDTTTTGLIRKSTPARWRSLCARRSSAPPSRSPAGAPDTLFLHYREDGNADGRADTPISNPWAWAPLASYGKQPPQPPAETTKQAIDHHHHHSSAKDQLTGQAVAVKKIMKPFSTPVLSKRTYRELKLLKHLKHENVRSLYLDKS